jgi:hypothetical protein
MTLVDGQRYFAPGVLMKDLDLDDHDALLSAFFRRVRGLFLSPILARTSRAGHDPALHASQSSGARQRDSAVASAVFRTEFWRHFGDGEGLEERSIARTT